MGLPFILGIDELMLDALRGLQATPRTTSVGVTPELRKAYEFYVKNYRH